MRDGPRKYLIRCRGGEITATEWDRFASLTRGRYVAAGEIDTSDVIAGRGRVVSVVPLITEAAS